MAQLLILLNFDFDMFGDLQQAQRFLFLLYDCKATLHPSTPVKQCINSPAPRPHLLQVSLKQFKSKSFDPVNNRETKFNPHQSLFREGKKGRKNKENK